MTEKRCELCARDVPTTTVHHLTPKSAAKRLKKKIAELPTADLCPACHRQIHALIDLEAMASSFHSIDSLLQNEKVAQYLRWIRKQPGTKGVRVRKNRW